MVLDVIFLIFAGYGFYVGYSKGIIGTVFTILAYVLGLIAGIKFAPTMTTVLEDLFNNTNPLMFFAGFLLSFVLVMIVIRTLAKGLEGLLKTANINIINQMMGGILFSAILIVLHSVLIWFGESAHIINEETKKTSITYPYVKPLPGQAFQLAQQLKPTFRDFWQEAMDAMDRLQGMSVERSDEEPDIFDLPDDEEDPNSSGQ